MVHNPFYSRIPNLQFTRSWLSRSYFTATICLNLSHEKLPHEYFRLFFAWAISLSFAYYTAVLYVGHLNYSPLSTVCSSAKEKVWITLSTEEISSSVRRQSDIQVGGNCVFPSSSLTGHQSLPPVAVVSSGCRSPPPQLEIRQSKLSNHPSSPSSPWALSGMTAVQFEMNEKV